MKPITLVTNKITPSLNKIVKQLESLPDKAYREFVKNTPVNKGNARRNTRLKGDIIEANYPYAKKLDEGYSKQAPQGMSQPTEVFVEKELKKIIRK